MKLIAIGIVLLALGCEGRSQNNNNGTGSAIAAGLSNTTVAGSWYNFIGAGAYNTNQANNSLIGAGLQNSLQSHRSGIVAGTSNRIFSNSLNSFIGAGSGNRIADNSLNSFIGAGASNSIQQRCDGSVIVGGNENEIYNGAIVSKGTNMIGGGYKNRIAEATFSSIAGGYQNTNRNSDYTFIGGGLYNLLSNNCVGSSIGGGFDNWIINGCEYSVVAGGREQTINVNSSYSTISGGYENSVLNVPYGTVGGGRTNVVQGTNGTVSGGASNTVSGSYATIPGGSENLASGQWSVAMGFRAKATNFGSMVIGLGPVEVASTTNSQFTVLAVGGTRIFSSAAGAGVRLSANATAWGVLSDRNSKENFRPIQPKLVLAKLAQMPVTEWNYKHDPGRRYIGPTSQDFHSTFGLGDDDKSITTLDTDGVLLASVQGLVEELQERDRMMAWEKLRSASALAERDVEIEQLRQSLHELKARVDSLSPPGKR